MTHHPMVTKGRAVNPSEMHHMEMGSTLNRRMAKIAGIKETGSAHPFNLVRNNNRLFAMNNAIRNHVTPKYKVPHGVAGPCGSAQNNDRVRRMTVSHVPLLTNVIRIAQRISVT